MPDGATVLQVLETFRNRSIQMALIVDKYGALRGVVTQTDLLEALAGEIKDDDELDVTRREDGAFLVDATMAIQDAFEQLGITSIPDDHSDDRTLAGFILRRHGHIPAVGEQFEWEAMEMSAVSKWLMWTNTASTKSSSRPQSHKRPRSW